MGRGMKNKRCKDCRGGVKVTYRKHVDRLKRTGQVLGECGARNTHTSTHRHAQSARGHAQGLCEPRAGGRPAWLPPNSPPRQQEADGQELETNKLESTRRHNPSVIT